MVARKRRQTDRNRKTEREREKENCRNNIYKVINRRRAADAATVLLTIQKDGNTNSITQIHIQMHEYARALSRHVTHRPYARVRKGLNANE